MGLPEIVFPQSAQRSGWLIVGRILSSPVQFLNAKVPALSQPALQYVQGECQVQDVSTDRSVSAIDVGDRRRNEN
jgi:hypothetical protein